MEQREKVTELIVDNDGNTMEDVQGNPKNVIINLLHGIMSPR